MIDTGIYNKNQKLYTKIVSQMYQDYQGGVTLTPEYAYYVEHDLLRILIRLARYKFVAKLLKKTDNVLEIGCGSGLGTIFLAQHSHFVTGLDVKTTEINEAKGINKRQNIEFVSQDFYNFPYKKKYDVIVALDVIEHLSPKNGTKLIREMAKHLRPNGFVVVGTPSIYSYPFQGKLSQASHIKCYDQTELCTLIEKYFGRTFPFSMNDEIVHTGNPKMAWYYIVMAYNPINN
jgi:2-polyprenyl-3-methyl-5-hydroxy-6-metoxy-1,4-benzoquinol methylase